MIRAQLLHLFHQQPLPPRLDLDFHRNRFGPRIWWGSTQTEHDIWAGCRPICHGIDPGRLPVLERLSVPQARARMLPVCSIAC